MPVCCGCTIARPCLLKITSGVYIAESLLSLCFSLIVVQLYICSWVPTYSDSDRVFGSQDVWSRLEESPAFQRYFAATFSCKNSTIHQLFSQEIGSSDLPITSDDGNDTSITTESWGWALGLDMTRSTYLICLVSIAIHVLWLITSIIILIQAGHERRVSTLVWIGITICVAILDIAYLLFYVIDSVGVLIGPNFTEFLNEHNIFELFVMPLIMCKFGFFLFLNLGLIYQVISGRPKKRDATLQSQQSLICAYDTGCSTDFSANSIDWRKLHDWKSTSWMSGHVVHGNTNPSFIDPMNFLDSDEELKDKPKRKILAPLNVVVRPEFQGDTRTAAPNMPPARDQNTPPYNVYNPLNRYLLQNEQSDPTNADNQQAGLFRTSVVQNRFVRKPNGENYFRRNGVRSNPQLNSDAYENAETRKIGVNPTVDLCGAYANHYSLQNEGKTAFGSVGPLDRQTSPALGEPDQQEPRGFFTPSVLSRSTCMPPISQLEIQNQARNLRKSSSEPETENEGNDTEHDEQNLVSNGDTPPRSTASNVTTSTSNFTYFPQEPPADY